MTHRRLFYLLSGLLGMASTPAHAIYCVTSSGQKIPTGGSSTPVDVRVHLQPNITSDTDGNFFNNITASSQIAVCYKDGDFAQWLTYDSDTLRIGPALTLPSSRFHALINGKYVSSTVSKGYVMVSSRTSEPIVAQLSFSLLDNLAPGFSIRQGTRIATLRLREENIYGCRDGCGTFAWNLIADNDAYFVTTGCNINARQPINVTFNDVRQDHLTTSAASARIVQEKQLTYQCGGSDSGAQDIDIRLISDAAPFSTELIKTSNANVGIALMYNGKQIAPNASFRTRIVNGRGSDTVSFNMVKNNVAYADIATGPLSGSATLILSPP